MHSSSPAGDLAVELGKHGYEMSQCSEVHGFHALYVQTGSNHHVCAQPVFENSIVDR
jgi:hypothetical protein